MKGYFIYFEGNDQHGVKKKITAQMKALSLFSNIEEINVPLLAKSPVEKIKSRFPFWGFGYDYEWVIQQVKDPDYIYIRHTLVDQDYIGFFRQLKMIYPEVKIICELYSYPYDKDFYWRKYTWPLYVKERLYRGKLKLYIDRFVTLTDDDEIFGIKTIKTVNGIDMDSIPFFEPNEINRDEIRLISVAVMQRHHGFERLIEGIYQYYCNGGHRNIIYTAVGDTVGSEVEKYMEMVKSFHLDKHVFFPGSKRGAELDTLLHSSDIGICSLGSYKSGTEASSQLKSREYLANGIPLLTGCRIDVLENSGFPYFIEYPNDPSPIDIERLISFYDEIYLKSGKTRREIALEIRKFAKDTVDIKKVMDPIRNYIISE